MRRRRFHQAVFLAAGLYNLAFGLFALSDPQWLFRFAGLPPLNHPAVYSCLGMVIALYGILYFEVARAPERGWLIAAVGLLGKALGPIGMAILIARDAWPLRAAVLCMGNDLLWWIPFALYLRDAWPFFAGDPRATARGGVNTMPEVYVSTDVEADGPIPGPNSMLSFASAAYLADKTLISTFTANLETLPGATGDPKTAAWWQTQPEAWEACRKDLQAPEQAMKAYLTWLKAIPGKPVFVGYPVAYDFMFVYWYLIRFTGESPFSHSALDMKTLAMALLKKEYRESTKRNMPKKWFDPLPHTHCALDDAIEQGALFCNMLAELRQSP